MFFVHFLSQRQQGKSRAESEFLSSESSLLIEDTAQQNSTEAPPEATQPPVDKCALSETPKKQNQQQQWVETLAPDLAQLLVDARLRSGTDVRSPTLSGQKRTLTQEKEQQRLTLRAFVLYPHNFLYA